jgi:hypothetical protein
MSLKAAVDFPTHFIASIHIHFHRFPLALLQSKGLNITKPCKGLLQVRSVPGL